MNKHGMHSFIASIMMLTVFNSFAQDLTSYWDKAKEYGRKGISGAQYYGKKTWKTAKRHKGTIAATVGTAAIVSAVIGAAYFGHTKSQAAIRAANEAGLDKSNFYKKEDQYNEAIIIIGSLQFFDAEKMSMSKQFDILLKEMYPILPSGFRRLGGELLVLHKDEIIEAAKIMKNR